MTSMGRKVREQRSSLVWGPSWPISHNGGLETEEGVREARVPHADTQRKEETTRFPASASLSPPTPAPLRPSPCLSSGLGEV